MIVSKENVNRALVAGALAIGSGAVLVDIFGPDHDRRELASAISRSKPQAEVVRLGEVEGARPPQSGDMAIIPAKPGVRVTHTPRSRWREMVGAMDILDGDEDGVISKGEQGYAIHLGIETVGVGKIYTAFRKCPTEDLVRLRLNHEYGSERGADGTLHRVYHDGCEQPVKGIKE